MAYLPDTRSPRSGDHPLSGLRKMVRFRGAILEPSDFAGLDLTDAQVGRLIDASQKAHPLHRGGDRSRAWQIVDDAFGAVVAELDGSTQAPTQGGGMPRQTPVEVGGPDAPAPVTPRADLDQIGASMFDDPFSPSEPAARIAPRGRTHHEIDHGPAAETNIDKIGDSIFGN